MGQRRNTALKMLADLALEAKKKQYPDFPYPVKPRFSDRTANGLTKCIITFLKLWGYQAERISNTGRMIDRRQKVTDVSGFTKVIGSTEWIPGTGTNGTADISATINGRSVKIEVKIGRDAQSEAQKTYQYDVERAGGIYIVAKDFQGFYDWFCRFDCYTMKGGGYARKATV